MNDSTIAIVSLVVSFLVTGLVLPTGLYLAKKVIENSTKIAVLESQLKSIRALLENISKKLDA